MLFYSVGHRSMMAACLGMKWVNPLYSWHPRSSIIIPLVTLYFLLQYYIMILSPRCVISNWSKYYVSFLVLCCQLSFCPNIICCFGNSYKWIHGMNLTLFLHKKLRKYRTKLKTQNPIWSQKMDRIHPHTPRYVIPPLEKL